MAKEFKIKDYIVNKLRQASYRTPVRSEALRRSRVGRNQYICVECGSSKIWGSKEVSVDHKNPVRPINMEWDWNMFINNLFCLENGADDLQILCKEHHKLKTCIENMLRRQYKKELTK